MASDRSATGRRFFAPEVVQTSAMDCGPAALKCLLEGFGIAVSYGRLREACQTDVDGTSIDTMEEVAVELGLDAEQIMQPPDHVLIPEAAALPAIAVVVRPGGMTHFVVVWRRHGHLVQVMDPATGRYWTTVSRFVRKIYVHSQRVPAAAFRQWTTTQEFLAPLGRRLAGLGLSRRDRDALIELPGAGEGWRAPALLDAATRMVDSIVRAGGLRRGNEARRLLESLLRKAREQPEQALEMIPQTYWMALPAPAENKGEEQIQVRGAVLVRVRGRRSAAHEQRDRPLSPELTAALAEPPARPGLELIRTLGADGWVGPAILSGGVVLAAFAVVAEALIFRGLIDLERELGLVGQRLGVIAALCALTLASLLLQLGSVQGALALGRRLETRLRVAFLEKLPRVGDRYFQSRLVSDMAERGHTLHYLRLVPQIGMEVVRWSAMLLLTVAGIIWLDPPSAPLALLAAFVTAAIPAAAVPLLAERDLRTRTHAGALARFYLDALLGLVAIRAHAAEASVRREHEGRLVDWIQAGLERTRMLSAVTAVHVLTGLSLAAVLLLGHLARGGQPGRALLLIYWALSLPLIGQELLLLARMIPVYRNVTLRLLEPLTVPEEVAAAPTQRGRSPVQSDHSPGVAIAMEGVSVRIAGHMVLEGIDLRIAAASHVAIVGSSGAGKSSLVGLLLGWNRAAAGRLLADGQPLEGEHLQRLREQTAWVDPAVQIWNRSLLGNLTYGAPDGHAQRVGRVVEQAHLLGVLQRLKDGMQTPLGEGGGLVSGGEGQRVRLGRAMMRDRARLVILDEPFRGLDRATRRELLARARQLWHDATLLFITHDMDEARSFERALVVDHGRIVEDGPPDELLARSESRYRQLWDAQEAVRAEIESSAGLRRIRIERGRLLDEAGAEAP